MASELDSGRIAGWVGILCARDSNICFKSHHTQTAWLPRLTMLEVGTLTSEEPLASLRGKAGMNFTMN
jgi:hypothetical protein